MPTGSTVVRLHAADADDGANAVVRYYLSSASHADHGDVFAVDKLTGDVVVVGELDFERAAEYHFEVCAVDGGPEVVTSSYAAVVVRVSDVNDNAPVIAVNTLTTSDAEVVEVVENAAAGTFVGHVTVRDADSGSNAQITCSLTSRSVDSPLRLEQVFDTEYQVYPSQKNAYLCIFVAYNVPRMSVILRLHKTHILIVNECNLLACT